MPTKILFFVLIVNEYPRPDRNFQMLAYWLAEHCIPAMRGSMARFVTSVA
jgi:hypothetical protein